MDQLSLLECSICGESFDCVERKPKLLPCCHTFCLSCLLEISARDGAGARCPVDEGLINADDPRNLKDNQQIMPWLKDPKTRLEMKARLAEHREVKVMRGCRDALVLEMQRQVAALLQQQPPEAGNSERGAAAAKLDKELKLLTCCETVSIASDTWRVEGVELEKQPALRIAMLLLLQQGALRNLQQQQQQQQQEQQPPAPLVQLNLELYENSGPKEYREEKVALLQSDIAVEALTGVCLDKDPIWVQSLLWRHSKTIQELQVEGDNYFRPLADLLASMPRLRKLELRSVNRGFPISRQWLGRLQSLKAWNCVAGIAASVLQAHRDTLQEVDLSEFNRSELLELQHMPALTKLAVYFERGDDKTALLEQWLGQLTVLNLGSLPQATALALSLLKAHRNSLQEVYVSVLSRDSLLELQQMPELRKLTIYRYDKDQPDDPALSAPWRGQLQFLDMDSDSDVPQATLLSLLTALSASLQELRFPVGVPPQPGSEEDWPKTCRDLPALLRQCNLQRLRTLKLERWYCSHNSTACKTQRDAVFAILPGCKVTCSSCSF